MRFTHARLILPDAVLRGTVEVQDGKITAVSTQPAKAKQRGDIDLKGGFLSPGFVDLHIHGAMRRDTMEASEEAFREITEFHLGGGTTSLTLTTLTAPEADILCVLDAVKPFHNQSLGGSRIVGVHVEGPFISKARAGAQDPAFIRPPTRREWSRYLAFGKLVTQFTLAPEEPGALELIRALRQRGIIASGGHTDALEPALVPALKAGLNQATHTFNAMSTVVRKGPYRHAGMIEFALAHPEITCELIGDGVHVPATLMKMLFNAKGRDGVCLITDATAGAGLKPGTRFQLGAIKAHVTPETAVLDDNSGLAGSTLTMIEAVRRSVELAGLPLEDAVRMASLNPARQLGRADEFGSIELGKRADLVWFNDRFQVQGAWLDGELRLLR